MSPSREIPCCCRHAEPIVLLQLLKASLVEISQETLPTSPQEREQYFMEQVAMGEGLAATGPVNEVSAALCFYRALRVYPSPVELIMSEYCLTYVVGVVFQLVSATLH